MSIVVNKNFVMLYKEKNNPFVGKKVLSKLNFKKSYLQKSIFSPRKSYISKKLKQNKRKKIEEFFFTKRNLSRKFFF